MAAFRKVVASTDVRHKTLEERIAGFDKVHKAAECNTGIPQGNEVW